MSSLCDAAAASRRASGASGCSPRRARCLLIRHSTAVRTSARLPASGVSWVFWHGVARTLARVAAWDRPFELGRLRTRPAGRALRAPMTRPRARLARREPAQPGHERERAERLDDAGACLQCCLPATVMARPGVAEACA